MDVHFYQTVARRGQSWTDDETSILLDIWLEKFKDVGSFDQKNGQIYQTIATEISGRGFIKSAAQCRTRMKTLKRVFKHCNATRRVGGLLSKLYWKVEKAVNLNTRSDLFSSNVSEGGAVKDSFEIVKTEILSDSDSEHSFQDHESLLGIADDKNNSLQAREYERLHIQNAVSNNGSSENPHQMQSFQINHETSFNTNSYVHNEERNQQGLSFNHVETPPVHEQSGLFGKGPQILDTEIQSSSGSHELCGSSTSVYQTDHQNQRKDGGNYVKQSYVGYTGQTTQNQGAVCSNSPSSSIRTETENNERFKHRNSTNLYNSINQKDSRKRFGFNCSLPSESHVDNASKKPRFENSNFQSFGNTSSSTNIQQNESSNEFPSDQIQTEQVHCVSPEINQNESPNSTDFTQASILETLCNLQKTLVSIVSQQTDLSDKLIDTEKERLLLRQKEVEVELKKQENEKERISMEERQRREDREHYYKMMQLVLGRLCPSSSVLDIQNGSLHLDNDKNTTQ